MSTPSAVPAVATARQDPRLTTAYRRISLRILPFLFLCFVVAYMDRINVGMAKLQMQDDLSLSAAA